MDKNDKKAETLLKKIQTILKSDKPQEVKLAEVTTTDGTVLSAETFEPGQSIYIVTEAGATPAPVGEYPLADGKKIIVEVEGLIGQVAEAAPAPAEVVDPVATLSKEDVTTMITNALKPVIEVITNLSDNKEQIKELETQLSKLSEEPANNGVQINPNGEEKAKGIRLTKSDGRTTTIQRVNAALFGGE